MVSGYELFEKGSSSSVILDNRLPSDIDKVSIIVCSDIFFNIDKGRRTETGKAVLEDCAYIQSIRISIDYKSHNSQIFHFPMNDIIKGKDSVFPIEIWERHSSYIINNIPIRASTYKNGDMSSGLKSVNIPYFVYPPSCKDDE